MAHGGGKLAIGKSSSDPLIGAALGVFKKIGKSFAHPPRSDNGAVLNQDTYYQARQIARGNSKNAAYRNTSMGRKTF